MSSWGNKPDRSEMPKFLSEEQKDRCIRTARGWEIQPHGNDNPASSELVVAIGDSSIEPVKKKRKSKNK